MKLSEIKGDRCIDVIAEIVDPIARIAQDPEAKRLFAREKPPEGTTPGEFFAQRVQKSLPKLLKDHKGDIVAILAAVNGVPAKQYARKMTMASLVSDVADLVTDEGFTAFFTSSLKTKEGTASGDA